MDLKNSTIGVRAVSNPATVRFDNRARDRQSNAQPVRFAGLKRLKEMWDHLGVNPPTVVGYCQHHVTGILAHSDTDMAV